MFNDFQNNIAPPAFSAVSAVEWLEYAPLTQTMTEQQPYPIESLGGVLAGLVVELSQTVQAPIPLIANSLLAAASLATQAHANVRLIQGSEAPTTLFAVTVGDSGERKSAIDHYALAPARAFQIALDDVYQAAYEFYRIDREAYDTALKKAKTGNRKLSREEFRAAIELIGAEPSPPIKPIILCSDPTAEGIFRQLSEGQPSIGLFSDEGGLFTSGHAMKEETKTATLARISKLWDGAEFDRVRSGDGISVLRGRRMALHLMMQSVVANQLFADPIANGQGFLARCLVTYPETTAGTRMFVDRDPKESAAYKRYYARMLSIFEQKPETHPNDPQRLQPHALDFSHSAKALLIEFHNSTEIELHSTGCYATIKGLGNKITEHASRMAGVIHVIEHGTDSRIINEVTTRKAIQLAQWYLNEWARISTVAMVPEHIKLGKTLYAWAISDRNTNKPYLHPSQIAKYAPNSVRRNAQYEAAINALIDHGLMREVGSMILDGKERKKVYEVREVEEETAKTAKTATTSFENEKTHFTHAPAMEEAF